MPEYGVPTGTIHVAGRVVDDQGAPIPGAQVTFDYAEFDTTDAEGTWALNQENAYFPCANGGQAHCTVEAEDIDGPANGGPYPPSEVVLNLVQTEPGSGSWDQGTWEQENIEIVLTNNKKESAPEQDGEKP